MQLGLQVSPLVEQLSARLWDLSAESSARNLGDVEVIAAKLCFVRQACEKGGDYCERVRLGLKPSKLRMMAITPGSTGEHLLGE